MGKERALGDAVGSVLHPVSRSRLRSVLRLVWGLVCVFALALAPAPTVVGCSSSDGNVDDSAVIVGRVVDAESLMPLMGVDVRTMPETTVATTDEDGKYTIASNAKLATRYQVLARLEGYEDQTKIITTAINQENRVDFALELQRVCSPGTRRCGDDAPERVEMCSARGDAWSVLETCDAGRSCQPSTASCITDRMVTVTRTAGGAVVSNPAGINCPPSCAVEFPDATTVSLTAVPFQMSTFVGWSGACEGAGTDPLCTLTLDADVAAGAAFDANAFALTVLRNGGGSGRVVSEPSGINCGSTCTAFFDRDSTVTLTATPNAGSEFGAWGGVCSGKTPTCQVTMDDARSVRARFDVPQAQLVVNKSGTGAGRVTSDVGDLDCGATCTVSVDVGTTI
ncbi:MAG: carboxypeptidase regulatory-like domain-containing protein, partial [Deltaproteobacteria bacterium]|nr:carboxypeptidase regulatory-like domain-containing protein [Deltaproteobacteria bacterium]